MAALARASYGHIALWTIATLVAVATVSAVKYHGSNSRDLEGASLDSFISKMVPGSKGISKGGKTRELSALARRGLNRLGHKRRHASDRDWVDMGENRASEKYERDEADHGPQWPDTHRRGVGVVEVRHNGDVYRRTRENKWREVEAEELAQEPARRGPYRIAAAMTHSSLETAVGETPMVTTSLFKKRTGGDALNNGSSVISNERVAAVNATQRNNQETRDRELLHSRLMSLPAIEREREAVFAIFRASGSLAAHADAYDALGESHCFLKGVQCFLEGMPGDRALLGHVVSLTLLRADIHEIPWQIKYLDKLRTLSIGMAGLKKIPSEISHLKRLESLDLRNNDLVELPSSIGELSSLMVLDLSSNLLESLPGEISSLENIRQLRLSRNHLTSLPDNIGNLKHLTKMEANENMLTSVPVSIGNLTKLHLLDLETNLIETLPDTMANLKGLMELDLENNRLKSLPDGLGELPRFTDIDLEGNMFEEFPMTVTRMKLMRRLRISRNRLRRLPGEIKNLSKVHTLYVAENKLESLPYELYYLKRLKKLDISGNQLADIGGGVGLTTRKARAALKAVGAKLQARRMGWKQMELDEARRGGIRAGSSLTGALDIVRLFTISHFTYLEELSADNCNITALPSDIGRLMKLKSLSLDDNGLTYLPESVGNLQDLRYISINNNLLQDLPESMAALRSVEYLNLGNNLMESIPRAVGFMTQVETMMLAGNRIRRIDAFEKNLKYLKTLDVSNNRVEFIQGSIFAQTGNLLELFLHNNLLRELPETIRSIRRCTAINLKNNRLELLPEGLYKLTMVTFLDLDGNNLVEISEEVHKMASLKVISGKRNRLATLPKKLGELKELIKVEMGHNNITYLSPSLFGEGMRGPRKLAKLYLNNNKLNSIPKEIAHLPALRVLDISYNSLTTIPPEFGNMAIPLEQLIMDHNRFYRDNLPSFLVPMLVEVVRNDMQCMAVKYKDSESQLMDPCRCRDRYWGRPPFCHACPADGVCEFGQLACVDGMMVQEGDCVACPIGGECKTGMPVVAAPGNWAESNSTLVFHTCPRPAACLGGSVKEDNTTCSYAHVGPLCASCIKGYYASTGGACTKCPPIYISITWLIGINAAGIAFCFWVFLRSGGKITLAKMKILFGFLQIFGSMDKTYEVKFPAVLQNIMRVFSFLNMDILRASSFECLFADDAAEYNFYHSLLVTLAVPIIIIMLLMLVYYSVVLWRKFSPSEFFSASSFKNKFIKLVMLLLMFGYLPVSSKGLRFFKCKRFDAGWFLEADYDLKCFTLEYYTYMGVALAIIVFYTIGVPVLIYVVIAFNRKQLHTQKVQERYGVLFRSYKDSYFGWELFDMVRRLILGGVAVYFSTNGRVQIIIAMIVCFFFFGYQMKAMPYKESLDNWLANVSQAILFMVLTLGILRDLNVSDEEKDMFMGFLVLCVAVLAIILIIAISIAGVKITMLAHMIWLKLMQLKAFHKAVMKIDDLWYKYTKPKITGNLLDPISGKYISIANVQNELEDNMRDIGELSESTLDAVVEQKGLAEQTAKRLGSKLGLDEKPGEVGDLDDAREGKNKPDDDSIF